MNKKSIFKPLRFVIVLVLAAMFTSGVYMQQPANAQSEPDGEDKKVDSFVTHLEHDGFAVAEGELGEFPLGRLCLIEGSPLDCLYFNASSPYLAAFMPVDLGEEEMWGYSGVVNSPLWRLRPDEAVVIVGRTPPPMRYFSLLGYLVKRYFPADEQGGAGYRTRFNNFGEQINNLTINSAGTPNGAAGNPFNSLFVYILTADRDTDTRVREAARRAGYAPPIMNTDPMPQSLLRMGNEAGDDLFALIWRTAHPADKQELADWKANPPLRIFRITPNIEPVEAVSKDPFPIPDFRARGTGQTEFNLLPAVRDLRQAILDRYSSPNLAADEFLSQVNFYFGGLHCLEWEINCVGPSPNALYLWNEDGIGTLGPDEFVIAYGVNHRLTGQASYMSVSMYGMTKHITNDSVDSAGGEGDQLIGTATDYLPASYPDGDKLYAYKFARNCGGEANCIEVPDDWPGVRPDEVATLTWRMYMNPTTGTAPDSSEVIFDRVIKFSPKP